MSSNSLHATFHMAGSVNVSVPVTKWFEVIEEETIADAKFEQPIHVSRCIEMNIESMHRIRIKKLVNVETGKLKKLT